MKRITYGLIFLALLALGIVAKQEFSAGAGPALSETRSSALTPASLSEVAAEPTTLQASAPLTGVALNSATISRADNAVAEAIQTPTQALSSIDLSSGNASNHGDSQALTKNDIEAANSNAVVDRPIPMSDSVAASCRDSVAKWGEVALCHILQRLSVMTQQPRDLVWAQEMEEKLRDIVHAEPGEYTIRVLECRQSLCVVEVASTNGLFPFIQRTGYSEPIHKEIAARDVQNAYEIDGSGAKVTVSLWLFERR